MKYYLMNKDNIVADIQSNIVLGTESYKVIKLYGNLPHGFIDINKWLDSRQAAKHRQHIKQLMKECGCDTIEGYIRVMHCTSINDTFWVKSDEEEVNWDKVSLYSNEFNDVIAKIAFEGVGLFGEKFSSTSPEFGTAGAYSKCCTKGLDNEMFMIKRGTEGYANAGLEPYCESLSSELYSIITKNSVDYKLVKFHGRMASKCKIFTNEAIGLAPYYNVSDISGVNAVEFYDKYGDANKFRNMLVADAVCFNEDRHSGNHGVLINNDTLEIVGMAPVYDNNISLLPYAMASDFNDINKYMEEHNTRLGEDWVRVARAALTSETRIELINLQGYKFKYEGDEKFTKERVCVISEMVNQQIKNILGKGIVVGFTGISSWETSKSCNVKERAKALLNGGR